MPTCHFHPTEPAVADLEVGRDDVPACTYCIADVIEDDRFGVTYYPLVHRDLGIGTVLRIVERRLQQATA